MSSASTHHLVAFLRRHIRILRLLGSVVLVVGIFWFIPISEVAESLRRLKLGYIGVAFALIFVSTLVQSLQFWLLLRRAGVSIGAREVFEINLVTRFYGQFLPSDLMVGAVRFYRLAGPRKQWGEVMAAQAYFRLVTTLALVVLGFVFWAVEMPAGAGRWVGALMIAMAVVLLALHAFLASNTPGRLARRLLPARALAWAAGPRTRKARELLQATAGSYRLFGDVAVPVVFLAVLRHLIDMLVFGLFALSVGVHLSYLTIGWIRVVLHVIMMLPITASGLGVREGSLVLLLREYAVPPSQAVTLSLVLFASNVLVNGIGGIFELVRLYRPVRPDAAGSGTA
jgi:uncharacterized protein (TIRG00374 family)